MQWMSVTYYLLCIPFEKKIYHKHYSSVELLVFVLLVYDIVYISFSKCLSLSKVQQKREENRNIKWITSFSCCILLAFFWGRHLCEKWQKLLHQINFIAAFFPFEHTKKFEYEISLRWTRLFYLQLSECTSTTHKKRNKTRDKNIRNQINCCFVTPLTKQEQSNYVSFIHFCFVREWHKRLCHWNFFFIWCTWIKIA